jgi:hypothetical protein
MLCWQRGAVHIVQLAIAQAEIVEGRAEIVQEFMLEVCKKDGELILMTV